MKSSLSFLSVSVALFVAGCAPSNPPPMLMGQGEVPREICFSQNLTELNHYQRQMQEKAAMEQALSNRDAFHANAPQSYVVKKGDTLWDLSRRFLAKPWYWKKIWHNNPHIKNPHRIYPGDVLSIISINGEPHLTITGSNNEYHGEYSGRRTKDGRQIVKYSPHVREMAIDESVSLAANTFKAHLLKSRLLPPAAVAQLPFVYGSGLDYVTLTQEQEIYAQGLQQAEAGSEWHIFRPAKIVHDPTDRSEEPRIIGQELRYVGKAAMTMQDDNSNVTRLRLQDVVDTVREGDVLLPPEQEYEGMNYFPQLPQAQCSRGYFVLNTSPLPSIKEFDSVVTSFGRDNGAQVGDVWKIVRPGQARTVKGQMVSTPDKDLGYLMIYRVEDEVSFGFVLESSQNIYMSDVLVRP